MLYLQHLLHASGWHRLTLGIVDDSTTLQYIELLLLDTLYLLCMRQRTLFGQKHIPLRVLHDKHTHACH
jgi:hypothetical protein